MEFEFDEAKSKSNLAKHGIDFVEAQQLWSDESAVLDSSYSSELRQLVAGKIGGRFHTAITTYRDGSIRIISVRRSRGKEIRAYDEHQSGRA